MKKYELYNLTTRELLADNLTFEEVPELFQAYVEFFPENEIIVCYREKTIVRPSARVVDPYEVDRNNFRAEWFNLMDELFAMGNIN